MNFFPVEIVDGMAVLADRSRLPLPFVPPGSRAVLGLRPEAMLPAREGLNVQVSLVEPLGSDTLAHFRLGAGTYVARVPPETRPTVGGVLTLAASPARMHLFDPDTGAVLSGLPAF